MATKQFIGNVKGQKGDKGVSITSVKQTTTSDIDGGINEITVTLSDGRKETFQVANGNTGKKGDQGVSVKTVAQTTTSNADGGSNVITVTLSDGTQAKFTVKNGNKGDKGDKGDTGDLSEECADARTSATGKSYDDLKARLDVEYNFLDTKANCIEGETSGDTITDSANAPLAYMKNSGYTKQDGTPTPDVPIHIDGLADKGYFDGDLVQGYIGSSGTITTDSHAVTSKNIIPCNEGDTIVINYEETVINLAIVTYNNGTYVGTIDGANVSSNSYTIPSGVDGFKFFIYDGNGITPSTAKHISVTINGQYAVRVKTCGKNLLKVEPKTVTANNCTFTFNEDGSITANGTNPNNWIANTIVDTIKLKAGTYTMSQNVTGTTNPYLYVVINGEWYTLVSNKSKTFTLTEDTEVIVYVGVYNKVTVTNATIYPQIELGEVATPYEPYTETTTAITIGAPLYEGDYIEIYADGSGKLFRAMAEVVFDGSETWAYWTNDSTAKYFYATLASLGCMEAASDNSRVCAYSSHFKGVERNNLPSSFELIATEIGYAQKSYLYFNTQVATSAAEWKTWLQSNPVTVVYELAEPTETELTAEQVAECMKLRTYKTTTHINADGEKVVRYVVDTKTYIDNKFAELQALMNV